MKDYTGFEGVPTIRLRICSMYLPIKEEDYTIIDYNLYIELLKRQTKKLARENKYLKKIGY